MAPEAADLVQALRDRGETVGCAESLTGGLVCAALTEVPGASLAVRGAVVSYATEVKAGVLGVDPGLLARAGAVHPLVAQQMAEGVRRVLGSDWGLATTGVAGPDPQDGVAVGTLFVAAIGPESSEVAEARLTGDRASIRVQAVTIALGLLRKALAAGAGGPRRAAH